ncbi:MAG TPA: hypothetical protein VI997_02330 [Candidatus Thermoplasmatota archaeon]|nr:hypothetical protein [Candidatus Thermoplasmatota archaeon]
MLASCANCAHAESGCCALGMTPGAGEILCQRYAMTTPFRDEVVRQALADIRREVDLAVFKHKVERSTHYAG